MLLELVELLLAVTSLFCNVTQQIKLM